MTEFHQNGRDSLLDAFLDGTMSEADRTAWLIRLREDVNLRLEVNRQEAIDAAIRRLYASSDDVATRCLAQLRQSPAQTLSTSVTSDSSCTVHQTATLAKQNRTRSVLALAATVGLCVVAGWQVKEFILPANQPTAYAVQKWRSMDRIYADELAGGFKPAWVCTNDVEFAKATRRELGQAVVLAQLPGISSLGWSYANTLSPNTLYLLALANETRVLVFMTPTTNDREPIVEPESGLRLHERVVGGVKLFEVSPQPDPLIIPHFYEPTP